jgi:hypothetical protein
MNRMQQQDTAAMLMAAIGQATADGIFDLMVGNCNSPDSINDFIDTLEYVQEQLAKPTNEVEHV